jgi:hypothetical protein
MEEILRSTQQQMPIYWFREFLHRLRQGLPSGAMLLAILLPGSAPAICGC